MAGCFDPIAKPSTLGERERYLGTSGFPRIKTAFWVQPGRTKGIRVWGDDTTRLVSLRPGEWNFLLRNFERVRISVNGLGVVSRQGRVVTLDHQATLDRQQRLPDQNGTLTTQADLPWMASEAPAGVVDGANQDFTLSWLPLGAAADASRVQLFLQGVVSTQLLIPEVDFTRSSRALALTTAPATGVLWAFYPAQAAVLASSLSGSAGFGSGGTGLTVRESSLVNVQAFGAGSAT